MDAILPAESDPYILVRVGRGLEQVRISELADTFKKENNILIIPRRAWDEKDGIERTLTPEEEKRVTALERSHQGGI